MGFIARNGAFLYGLATGVAIIAEAYIFTAVIVVLFIITNAITSMRWD